MTTKPLEYDSQGKLKNKQSSRGIKQRNDLPKESIIVEIPPRFENYKLIKKLGQGAFGTVWKGKNEKTDDSVAIKIQPKSFLTEGEKMILSTLKNECSNHNVLCMKDSGTLPISLIVTEFLNGPSMQHIIRTRKGATSLEQLQTFTRQLLDAVYYIHMKNIIHRDIKPENIMVSEDGSHLTLVDFGIGCINQECFEVVYGVIGTEDYIYPPLLSAMRKAQQTNTPIIVSMEEWMINDYYAAAKSLIEFGVNFQDSEQVKLLQVGMKNPNLFTQAASAVTERSINKSMM